MSEKLTEQLTLKVSPRQLDALQAEAYLRGCGMADVVRDFIDELHCRHLRAYRLLKREAERDGNMENEDY